MSDQGEKLVLTEREALDIIAFLVSSAEISTYEPTYYGSFRLIDAASRLMAHMQQHDLPLTGSFITELKAHIDEKKTMMMFDRPAWVDFLKGNPAMVASELKRVSELES
jgi:hypothetical protein